MAWKVADDQMAYPRKVATQFNAREAAEAFPTSPGFKLVAVREAVPDERAVTVRADQERPSREGQYEAGSLTLHRASDRRVIHLIQRYEQDDASDSYVDRVKKGTLRRLKELTKDYDLREIAKPELDSIRLAFQNKRKKSGQLRGRGTIDTELGHVRSMFQWLVDCDLWNPCRDWQRWLRAAHRSDENDDDADKEKTVETYELEELVKIYAAAQPSCRLWILLGLNFNWGDKEIATARKRHFKRESGDQRVARYRHKRKPGAKPVPGRWTAWSETWEMALARLDQTTNDPVVNPKGRAFLTRQNWRPRFCNIRERKVPVS